jgi:uncharacterized protein
LIYLDASALVTFVTSRSHASELRKYLAGRPPTITATSTIGLIETVRACDRIGTFPDLMSRLSDAYTEIPLSEEVRNLAAQVPARVRTLDAVHIASAQVLGSELTALITYDKRMWEVADSIGLPVVAPGMR